MTVATPLPGLMSKLLAVPESVISGTAATGGGLPRSARPGKLVPELRVVPRVPGQLHHDYRARVRQ